MEENKVSNEEINNLSQLDDGRTLSVLTNSVINKIEDEKFVLKKKQKEIDELIEHLRKDVIESETESKDFRKARSMSASEKMEKIKAFVELLKSSVDISKSIIGITEREHKLMMDAYNTYKKYKGDEPETEKKLSPTQVAKALKRIQNKEN